MFTNDLRISVLDTSLQKAGECFVTNTVPSSAEDKSANNNMMTLGFYFTLNENSNCAKAAANGDVRAVVLNFIKKFQFPNLRTNAAYMDCYNDGITLAPMRMIVKVLYTMNLMYGNVVAYLTKDEIKNFIFYNESVAKKKHPDLVQLIQAIIQYRKDGFFPPEIDTDENNHEWKHEDRQIREMIKVLQWSGCVKELDGKYVIDNDDLSRGNKADIFDIISYDKMWEGNTIQSYREYMDMESVESVATYDNLSKENEITPEWFKEKALEFPTLDQEAEEFRQAFIEKFSPERLKSLADIELLETIFLNANNKTNLCYTLEFDTDSRFIFGSIKSGTAYKYGLHYSQKNGSWATGTGRNPQLLSEEEAIELGTKIRDNLVAGVEVLEELKDIQFVDDYEELYSRLFQVTDGFINRVWFLKYYAILFPTIFPPNYSANAQNTIIEKLALNKSDNTVIRMGIIRDYVDKCEISGVVFSRIFWKYCNNKDDDTEINEDEEIKEEEATMLNCLEKERNPRTVKIHPLNSIIYGAPGTGKTYSTSEYAQAIIEGVSLETFRANNPDRKEVMKKYNELVKAGQVVFTTFHQSYGYEEFIQGLRPDTTSDKMNFKTVDGVFKKIADRALNDDENNYVIIIDEINRANISKVFGELITLIEDDKRWGELNQTSVTLQSGDPFAVPNNLYIVGTMNSADKSISLIDAALRRRFEFIEQKPDASLITDPTMRSILIKLNDMLADQLDSADLLIGHSYFMNKTVDDLPKVLNNSIIPLLYEYFYDNKKKVMGVLNSAIEQVDYVIEDDKLGRIYVERQTKN